MAALIFFLEKIDSHEIVEYFIFSTTEIATNSVVSDGLPDR